MSYVSKAPFEAIAGLNKEFSQLRDLQDEAAAIKASGGGSRGRENAVAAQQQICKNRLTALVSELRTEAWVRTIEHFGHLLVFESFVAPDHVLTPTDAEQIIKQLLLFLGQSTEAQVQHLAYLENWQRNQDRATASMSW